MAAERADAVELVVFAVGDREFAVESGRIEEAVDHPAVTRVPGTPPAVEGVADVRGAVTAVVDAAALLPEEPADRVPGAVPPGAGGAVLAEEADSADPDRLLVLDRPGDGGRVALHVGAVERVAVVPLDDVDRSPAASALAEGGRPSLDPDLVAALARDDDRVLPVLDPDAVAAPAE